VDIPLRTRRGGVGRRLRVHIADVPRDAGLDPHREHLDPLKQRFREGAELALVLGVEVPQQPCAGGLIDWSFCDRHRNRLEQLLGVAHQRGPSQLGLAPRHRCFRTRLRSVDGRLQLLWIERTSRAALNLVVLDEVAGRDPIRRQGGGAVSERDHDLLAAELCREPPRVERARAAVRVHDEVARVEPLLERPLTD
jgi:hypothetical protein